MPLGPVVRLRVLPGAAAVCRWQSRRSGGRKRSKRYVNKAAMCGLARRCERRKTGLELKRRAAYNRAPYYSPRDSTLLKLTDEIVVAENKHQSVDGRGVVPSTSGRQAHVDKTTVNDVIGVRCTETSS